MTKQISLDHEKICIQKTTQRIFLSSGSGDIIRALDLFLFWTSVAALLALLSPIK